MSASRSKTAGRAVVESRESRAAVNGDHLSGEFFRPGAVVLITLNNPREKFWGALLQVTAAGISVAGLELASFDDAVQTVTAGEELSPNILFFPMHRLERIELDAPSGTIPSLSQRFEARTGSSPAAVLMNPGKRGAGA